MNPQSLQRNIFNNVENLQNHEEVCCRYEFFFGRGESKPRNIARRGGREENKKKNENKKKKN